MSIKLLFDLFIAVSICMAALLLKHSVSKIPEVKPKNKYVIIHCCNFTIWVIFYLVFAIGTEIWKFGTKNLPNFEQGLFMVAFFLEDLVATCIDCFLLWQVLRYARGKDISRTNKNELDILRVTSVRTLKTHMQLNESTK